MKMDLEKFSCSEGKQISSIKFLVLSDHTLLWFTLNIFMKLEFAYCIVTVSPSLGFDVDAVPHNALIFLMLYGSSPGTYL